MGCAIVYYLRDVMFGIIASEKQAVLIRIVGLKTKGVIIKDCKGKGKGMMKRNIAAAAAIGGEEFLV